MDVDFLLADNCHINPNTPHLEKSTPQAVKDWAVQAWSTASDGKVLKEFGKGLGDVTTTSGALKTIGGVAVGIGARAIGGTLAAVPASAYLLGREGAMLAINGPAAAADDTWALVVGEPVDRLSNAYAAAEVVHKNDTTNPQRLDAAKLQLRDAGAGILPMIGMAVGGASGDLGPQALNVAKAGSQATAMAIGRFSFGDPLGLEPAYANIGQLPASEIAGLAKGSPGIRAVATAEAGTVVLSQNMGDSGGSKPRPGDKPITEIPTRGADGTFKFESGPLRGAVATDVSEADGQIVIQNKAGLFPDKAASPVRMIWNAGKQSLTKEFAKPTLMDGMAVTRYTEAPSAGTILQDKLIAGKGEENSETGLYGHLLKLAGAFTDRSELADTSPDLLAKRYVKTYENPHGIGTDGAVRVTRGPDPETDHFGDIFGISKTSEMREYAKPTTIDKRTVEKMEVLTTSRLGKPPQETRRYFNSQGMESPLSPPGEKPVLIETGEDGKDRYLEFRKPVTLHTRLGDVNFTTYKIDSGMSEDFTNPNGLGLADRGNPTKLWLAEDACTEEWGAHPAEVHTSYGDLKIDRRETDFTDSTMQKIKRVEYSNSRGELLDDSTSLTRLAFLGNGAVVEEYGAGAEVDGIKDVMTRSITPDKKSISYVRGDGSEVRATRTANGFTYRETKPPGDHDLLPDWFN
jgi:hypothetical protein